LATPLLVVDQQQSHGEGLLQMKRSTMMIRHRLMSYHEIQEPLKGPAPAQMLAVRKYAPTMTMNPLGSDDCPLPLQDKYYEKLSILAPRL
jgi:hypothetical protein